MNIKLNPAVTVQGFRLTLRAALLISTDGGDRSRFGSTGLLSGGVSKIKIILLQNYYSFALISAVTNNITCESNFDAL